MSRPYHYEVITYEAVGEPFPHPLLFVHGAWHAAWCWDIYFLPYFAERGYNVNAFSLRGHGGSDGRSTLPITRIQDYVDDLRIILATYDTPPILIGHSMGAFLIQHLLQTRHDIPAAVFLAPIPAFGVRGLAWRTATRRPRIALHILLTWDVYPLVAEPAPDGERFFSPFMPPEEAADYMRRFTHESFAAVGIDALLLDLPRPAKISTPLLIVGGAHDTLFTPAEVRRTAQLYSTEAIIMPDMGHELMLDPGHEQVAAHIHQWLITIIYNSSKHPKP